MHNQIFRIDPGPNGLFDGTDDVVSCFDTKSLGIRDPEGMTIDPATGDFYVVGLTDRGVAVASPSGELVDLINLTGVLPFSTQTMSPAGVALAPASDDPNRTDLYVADRAVDNNVDPNEVDGKVYEVRLNDPSGNMPPVVASPGRQPVVEGEVVRLKVVAADPNGEPAHVLGHGNAPARPLVRPVDAPRHRHRRGRGGGRRRPDDVQLDRARVRREPHDEPDHQLGRHDRHTRPAAHAHALPGTRRAT